MSEIRVGTSGWSYPSGAGHVERDLLPGRSEATEAGFDDLAFYAEHFDTVEVNSSFYGVPTVETTTAWASRTPADFEFSLKLYQKFTHPEMFLKATGQDPADLDRKDVDAFRAAIDPLARAGKLGRAPRAVPGQLQERAARRATISSGCCTRSRTIRWRSSCGTAASATTRSRRLQLLGEHGAALVQIDEPKFRDSIRQNRLPNVKTFYYMRLHGRNAAQWWSAREVRGPLQLSVFGIRAGADRRRRSKEASRDVKKTYMYANNHFSAKSVANAATIKHKLGQPLDGEYPEAFVERYPDLKGLVKILPPTSFR